MGILFTIAVFIVVLGIMIFVHELGHFLVAKHVGVKVLEFCLGMGPKLYGHKRGETEYMLKLFPIGGSIKMLGEEPDEADAEKIDPAELGRAFFAQAPHKRIAITAAGPLLNIVLAILLAPIIYLIGIDIPAYLRQKPVVYAIQKGGPADLAGFRTGDEILQAGDKKFSNWEDLRAFTALNPEQTFKYTVLRGGDRIELTMTIGRDPDRDNGFDGIEPAATNIIGELAENSPAKQAGIKVRDEISAINGQSVTTFSDIVTIVRASKGKPIAIDIIRDKQHLVFNVTPVYSNKLDAFMIGVSPEALPTIYEKYSLGRSIKEGMKFLVGQLGLAGLAMKKLLTGQIGRKALGGPIEIAQLVGFAARKGLSYLINITAVICIWLGVLNLFPFPALDGGHIIFAGIEIVSRRRLNQKVVNIMNQVGFAMLMALIVLVTYQDLKRNLGDTIKRLF